ncbi:hypothetical protein RSAG8_05443, partial [Rhizoctonia solani AG-8 WAC10335]
PELGLTKYCYLDHDPATVSEVERPSGQVNEDTPSKKKKKGSCPTVPAAGVDGLCNIIFGALCCLCRGLN